MKKLIALALALLLVFPAVIASTEADQLNSIIRQVKDSILLLQVRGKPCLTPAFYLLKNRMDEMVGAVGFLEHIANPVTWARQLLLRFPVDLAISVGETLHEKIKDYATSGGELYFREYEPGWWRSAWGDECKNFQLQFIWLKDENVVKVISSGDCQCDADLKDFYIQFDVHLKVNENAEPDASNRYQLKGFSNSNYPALEYFINPEDEANAVMKVNCCNKKSDNINYPDPCEEEEVSYSLPRDLFTDPDEFLAALDTGKFVPTQKDREYFMRSTLCSKIADPVKQQDDDAIPDDSTTTPDPFTETAPDPVRTPPETLPPSVSLPPTEKSCEERCEESGWSTEKQSYSSYIINEINKYECASSAKVVFPKHNIDECICYDPKEMPEIDVNTEKPVCKDTFCGDVPCGEERRCEEPGAAYSADCRWEGWQGDSSSGFVGTVDVY